ncbi:MULTISPECIES: TauD/TfdA family dioxygenase [unclassified Bradyrhizobium]|uniref:TauD/TfdA dioxygenase family protein n=1 Tax=unclassified Bradyrhizobium TaxID=2631580 RepID=UPI001FFC28A2|nr:MULTISPECIES: TauD/TfdA family dioxygenase [unclassified Bradyrhizobium]MCK1348486.1 TauD/TfdA family dioxygenase [Bradyrhizobium sp. CW11]MCK1704112.1 TauD/TfdA family dioxygenase [Bradyrhizobium sp. 146]
MQNAGISDGFIPRGNIIKCASRLGAEIVNVRLSAESPPDVLCAIRHLVREHKVIFFRDQTHLDQVEHERLATVLAKLGKQHPLGRPSVPSSMAATELDDHRSTNITCQVEPGIAVLRVLAIAPGARETAWSNMRAAYLDLPPPLRKLADELWAVQNDDSPEGRDSDATGATMTFSDHPVVRIHPETGERLLALGNFRGRFVGLQRDTSEKLFDMLRSYIVAPGNAVRWSWRIGDVAIWDNRAAQHYPIHDEQSGIFLDNFGRELSPRAKRRRSGQRAIAPTAEAARAA